MEKTSPYRMYLIQKLCTTLGSVSKEGLYDHGFLNKSRFKAHTIVEDEMWILVRVILVADDRFSNAIMSDVNGGLQSFSHGLSGPKNFSTCSLLGRLVLKPKLKKQLMKDDFPTPV